MLWIHKSQENAWENAPCPGVRFCGPNAEVGKNGPLVIFKVTSILDLTAESTVEGNVITHRLFEGNTPLGKITDVFSAEGWTREFRLTLPLSFYFENLPDHPLYHITPNRLYQEDGELIFRESAEKNQGLYFQGKNCILHTERNQLQVTAKAGDSTWVFRYEK